MQYQAPEITSRQPLGASLITISQERQVSDAAVKHTVQPVTGYEAPEITGTHPLGGNLQFASNLTK